MMIETALDKTEHGAVDGEDRGIWLNPAQVASVEIGPNHDTIVVMADGRRLIVTSGATDLADRLGGDR